MLSNPPQPSGLHPRQRQHRRQNSTPTVFEAVKIAPLPNIQQRQNVSHRRGLSLDTRRQHISPTTATTTSRQDYTTVSTTTNPGLSTTPQHVLRETQQQRIARPGSSHTTYSDISSTHSDSENFLISPHGTPQSQHFVDVFSTHGQMDGMTGLSFDSYMAPMMLKKSPSSFSTGNPLNQAQDFDFYGPDSALSTPTFMTFPDASPAGSAQGWISESETASTQTRRTSRRISNGIMDKVAKFEAMGTARYFPPTPTDTPHNRILKQDTIRQRPSRFSEDYDESMEETIKPVRGNRSSNRNSGIFDDLRQQAETLAQTPPRANTMPMNFAAQGLSTPNFMNMSSMNAGLTAEFVKTEYEFDGMPNLNIHNAFDNKPDLRPQPDRNSQNTIIPHGSQSTSRGNSSSPTRHRRTDSIASIASAASIADINIEETKTETGVTLDDIAQYIEGPDPSDGKWICLYEDCHKRFGRKENIKSHVQTHLNDRQYQCPTCKKCFVRQHDLKRHAKIHTGVKPYPCECGNSFARHDALTRHRQRGMCIGAFDGIVRKVVKRGRPRKNRPELDERIEKSERTRRKNKHSSASSVSSFSGYSDSSAPNSPGNDYDGVLDDPHFPDMMDVAMGIHPSSLPMNAHSLAVSSAPMPSLEVGRRPMSPATHVPGSPSAMSNYSHVSRASIAGPSSRTNTATDFTGLPAAHDAASPAKSVSSHYTQMTNTPPGLSSSSSPPPNNNLGARFFELDPNNSGISDMTIGLGTTVAAHAAANAVGCGTSGSEMPSLVTMGDDDMMLQFTTDDGLVQLDSNMMGKFEEDYDSAVNMFTNNDDSIFFGCS